MPSAARLFCENNAAETGLLPLASLVFVETPIANYYWLSPITPWELNALCVPQRIDADIDELVTVIVLLQ